MHMRCHSVLAACHAPQARKEAESWRPRLDAAEKELFKLERGLEMKVGRSIWCHGLLECTNW